MPRRRAQPLTLKPELVPSDLWGRSASKMLKGKSTWTKKIRFEAIEKAGNRCEICGVQANRLICHDKWHYDDKTALANLVAFEIHCGPCDLVCHFKRMMQVQDPETVLVDAIEQLCAVNGYKEEDAVETILQACNVWERRNRKRWGIVVASELLTRYPELAGLPAFVPAKSF